jgi:hypothetical protein
MNTHLAEINFGLCAWMLAFAGMTKEGDRI